MYLLIIVAPSGKMSCMVTEDYMVAEKIKLDPDWIAFVVEPKSIQVRSGK